MAFTPKAKMVGSKPAPAAKTSPFGGAGKAPMTTNTPGPLKAPSIDPLSDKVKAAATPKKLFSRKAGNPFQQGLSANPAIQTKPVAPIAPSVSNTGSLTASKGPFKSSMGKG